MFSTKLTTQTNRRTPRLVLAIEPSMMGKNWKKNDLIRVITNKDDNSLTLMNVGTKANKTITHTLTTTGRGEYSHNLGIYVSYRDNRFKDTFKRDVSVFAEDVQPQADGSVKIKLPKEIFM